MKLRSGRIYKHDLSDVVGILHSQMINGNRLSKEQVINAYKELYNTEEMDKRVESFFNIIIDYDLKQLEEEFINIQNDEEINKELLHEFNELYHTRLDRDKINETIENFKQSKQRKDM